MAFFSPFLIFLTIPMNITIHYQVSVASYGQGVTLNFDLDEASDVQTALQKIKELQFPGGTSDAAEAIK